MAKMNVMYAIKMKGENMRRNFLNVLISICAVGAAFASALVLGVSVLLSYGDGDYFEFNVYTSWLVGSLILLLLATKVFSTNAKRNQYEIGLRFLSLSIAIVISGGISKIYQNLFYMMIALAISVIIFNYAISVIFKTADFKIKHPTK